MQHVSLLERLRLYRVYAFTGSLTIISSNTSSLGISMITSFLFFFFCFLFQFSSIMHHLLCIHFVLLFISLSEEDEAIFLFMLLFFSSIDDGFSLCLLINKHMICLRFLTLSLFINIIRLFLYKIFFL